MTKQIVRPGDQVAVCVPSSVNRGRPHWKGHRWKNAEVLVISGLEALIHEPGVKGKSWIPVEFLRRKRIRVGDFVEVCTPWITEGSQLWWHSRKWENCVVLVVKGKEAIIHERGRDGVSWIPLEYLRPKTKAKA